MKFLKKLFKIGNHQSTKSAPKEWNGPKYIISFPDENNPFIPHYRIEGQTDEWTVLPSNGYLYYDPIEDLPEFKEISAAVEQMVDKELGKDAGKLGSCHKAWAIQKRILKECYGIEWHPVSALNPMCHFD